MIKYLTDICGCDPQGIMVSNRVDFWPNKSQKTTKKQLNAVNHVSTNKAKPTVQHREDK